MLLYEYQVRDKFDRLRDYCERIKKAFEDRRSVSDLRQDVESLGALHSDLLEALPASVRVVGNFERHLAWLRRRLAEDSPDLCQKDIEDISRLDLPALEAAFRDWCRTTEHTDAELAEKVGPLLLRRELDSAIRKGFVILKSRIVAHFHANPSLDGEDLINSIFGSSPHASLTLSAADRQVVRNLLSGLYGWFRNLLAHEDYSPEPFEVDAALSTINWALKSLPGFTS